MKSTFSSLQFFNYRLWFFGALVCNVGTWMQRIAQDWLVLTGLTHDSGLAVGVVTALQFLPTLLLSPYAGVLADRLPRRKLLIATQAGQGVLALGLGAIVLAGQASLPIVYGFALALGVVTTLDSPVRQTFVAEMVPPQKLPNAVGLNSASFNAARLIGPGIAGVLIAAFGSGPVFMINGVTFLATILSLTAMRTSELHPMPHAPRAKGQIREGLAYVRGRSDIVVVMVIAGVVSAFGLNFQLTSGVMARQVFDRGAGEFGLLASVMAVGSVVGALLAARRERPRVRLVIGACLAFGVAAGISALMPTYGTYAASGMLVGLCSLTLITAANSTVQVSTDPAMRGRVMALYTMVFLGATPIGSPIVGWISEAWGARWSIGVGAIASLLVGAGAAIWAMRHWHVELHYSLTRSPHLRITHPAADAAAASRLQAPAGQLAAGTRAVEGGEPAASSQSEPAVGTVEALEETAALDAAARMEAPVLPEVTAPGVLRAEVSPPPQADAARPEPDRPSGADGPDPGQAPSPAVDLDAPVCPSGPGAPCAGEDRMRAPGRRTGKDRGADRPAPGRSYRRSTSRREPASGGSRRREP